MSRSLSFFVPGICQPAGSKRIGRHGDRPIVLDANPKASDWKQRVALAAAEEKRKAGIERLLTGALKLQVWVFRSRPKGHLNAKGEVRPSAPKYPTGKPDLTKLVRGLEDGLRGVVYTDDALIVEQRNCKWWADDNEKDPGVYVIVSEID